MSYTREHGSVASTPKSLDLLKGSCSAAETQHKISKLAELTARTFFDFISESRRSDNSGGGDSPPKLNFSQVLEHADKFNKVFVDTLTLKWNEIQVGKSPDYSQHCDSADEDEVFENSLYQPCPEDPGQYEPVYENSMESEYDTARDGDYSEDNSQSFGDVTPTPPTESHYSAMQDCDSNSGGKSSHDRLYDSPPAGNSSAAATLEEQLISHFAAQGFKLSSDKGDSSSTASSERNSLHSSKSDQKEHELSGGGNEVTSSSIEAEKRSSKPPSPSANSSASDISGGKNEIYEKSSGLGSNQTNDSQQPGKQRPKLKNAIMDLGSEASEFLRSKKSTDSPKPSLKSGNDMAQNQPKSAPVVIKKESVLEVRIHKTAADAAPSSWQPCRDGF